MKKQYALTLVLTSFVFANTLVAQQSTTPQTAPQQPASSTVVPLEQRSLPVKKKTAGVQSVATMQIKPAAKRTTALTRSSPVTTHKRAKKAGK